MKFECIKLLFIFILNLMVSAENSINTCRKIIKLTQNNECNEKHIIYDSKSCNGEITWTLINSTLGLVDVEFHPCGNSYFEITLNVQETEGSICNFNGIWKRHSVYIHRRTRSNEDGLPECSQVARIQLQNIFPGCYQIKIEAKYGSDPANSSTKYLETKYVKYIFDENDIEAEHQQRYADNKTYLITEFKYPEYSQNVQLCFHLENEIENDRLVWNVSCPVEDNDNVCRITIYGQNKNVVCSSLRKETKIIIFCNLYGLIPGNYVFEKFILNEPIRCNVYENSVWGNKQCHWMHFLNLTEENIINNDHKPNDNSSIYLIGISILVVLCVTLILIYFIHKKIQKNKLIKMIPDIIYDPKDCDELSDENLIENPGILLLYARDCDLFMDTMSSFRRLLQISGNYQIFDMHDPDRYSEILTESPSILLHQKIMDPNIKIILVLSECGDYLIQEQKTYKNSKCIDTLYNYGVRILLQNSFSLSCDKLFVTKFSFFEESGATSILSPNRRYDLDNFDNVIILLKDLLNTTEFEGNSVILKESIEFNKTSKYLIDFVEGNPSYLIDILKLT